MAKQTFTTGQVLTADQMTSLQQTAMGGGAATAKTANYVLVAADAGTTVAMNAAGATTITVNTGLFAAGDTVFIQNLGAGACTVTAGTATVATAGSLILPQNDAGILYFTSASAAIFYDYIQVGAASPLTTKGDLYTFGTSDTRLGVGANGTTLVADSSESLGIKWAAPAGAKSYSLLSTTTLSGASTTISSLSGYDNFFILIRGASSTVASRSLVMQINAIGTPSNYREMGGRTIAQSTYSAAGLLTEIDYFENNGQLYIGKMGDNVSSTISGFIQIAGANTSGTKVLNYGTTGSNGGANLNAMSLLGSISKDTAVVSSLKFYFDSGDLDAGTVYIYGAA